MRIVFLTDNFLLGGRETFVSTCLGGLQKEFNYRGALIASRVLPEAPGLELFEDRFIAAKENLGLYGWLQQALAWLGNWRPDLIWAQHFGLLEAWLLSQLSQTPLLSTMHGPLIGAGRPNRPLQALGLTLAIHRGHGLSAVSEEAIDSLRPLVPQRPIHYFPNTVSFSLFKDNKSLTGLPKKFLMVTRREKLDHIRQGLQFFHSWRRRTGKGKVILVAGTDLGGEIAKGWPSQIVNLRKSIKLLGKQWCLAQGVDFLRTLQYVNIIDQSRRPRELMKHADVVLGMGRVILESMAEGRLAFLVGYDRICGPVTQENFFIFQKSNFSGRRIRSLSLAEACEQLADWNALERPGWEQLSAINAEYITPRFSLLLTEIANSAGKFKYEFSPENFLKKETTTDAEIFSKAAAILTNREWESFYHLSVG